MARSILRMSRTDKHQRLFELIRQGKLADPARAPAERPIKPRASGG